MTRIALALLAALLCAAPPPAAAQTAAPAVVSAQAERRALARQSVFTGRVVALQRVELRARVQGVLQETAFEEGAPVAAGDVLFRIEPDAYRAEVARIEGAILAAEAELRLAEIERDRQATLVARGTAAQAQLDTAEAQLGVATGRLRQLEADLTRAALDLSYTEVTAPFDGIPGRAMWDVGAFVGPDAGALVALVGQDPMTVEFPLPSSVAFRIRSRAADPAQQVVTRVRLPDGTVYGETGTIDFVDVEVNQGTDTLLLRASFPNPDRLLIHGALVGVLISQAAPEEALSIPQQAVQQDLQGAFVMTVDDASLAQVRRVIVERYAEGRAVIASGLEAGETVIVEGVNKARPGRPVDAAPMALPAQDG